MARIRYCRWCGKINNRSSVVCSVKCKKAYVHWQYSQMGFKRIIHLYRKDLHREDGHSVQYKVQVTINQTISEGMYLT